MTAAARTPGCTTIALRETFGHGLGMICLGFGRVTSVKIIVQKLQVILDTTTGGALHMTLPSPVKSDGLLESCL